MPSRKEAHAKVDKLIKSTSPKAQAELKKIIDAAIKSHIKEMKKLS